MGRISTLFIPVFMLGIIVGLVGCSGNNTTTVSTFTPTPEAITIEEERVRLPEPRLEGNMSLEETLFHRRSVRDYINDPLSIEQVSQLLWAAQGITSSWGGRTAPSAGALYPLEVYIVVGLVEDMMPGVYKYLPRTHELVLIKNGDVRNKLSSAALGQNSVQEAPIDIVIAAVYERTTKKYTDRGIRYVHMEAGHSGQNLYLQATALNLGMVTIGAFLDQRVQEIIGMDQDEEPLYIIPIGKQ